MADTRTFKAALNQVSEWYAEEVAFVQAEGGPDRRYTYAEANREARRFANALATLGVGKGDRVAFLTPPAVEHAIAYFGCLKLGAIAVNVSRREATGVIVSLLEDIQPSCLVFHPDLEDTVVDVADRAPTDEFVSLPVGEPPAFGTAYDDFVAGAGVEEPETTVEPADVAIISFTSGTTGQGKPITHTHEELVEAAHHSQFVYGGRYTDNFLNKTPPSAIAWLLSQLPFLNVGATVVMLEQWRPVPVLETLEAEAITVVTHVTTQWKLLLQEDVEAYDLSELRVVGAAGEPIGTDVASEIRERFPGEFVVIYGSTETLSSGIVLLPEDVDETTLDSIGRPVPNVDVRLIDPDARDPEETVPDGEVGELIVNGPAVSEQGVWNDPERTAEMFHEDGWWYSNDLARRGEDGLLYLSGRKNDMIISGGLNISPFPIEDLLRTHEGVAQVAVVGVPDEKWGETVMAVVVADGDVDADALDEWCQASEDLADYKRPRRYAFVDELPRNLAGKVDRAALKDRYAEPEDA